MGSGVRLRATLLLCALASCESAPLAPRPEGPRVIGVSPGANGPVTAHNLEIIIEFEAPLEAASVDDADVQLFGRWTGVVAGTVVLENAGRRLRFTPLGSLGAGELVTASIAAGAVRGVDGNATVRGHAWMFWTLPVPSGASFGNGVQRSLRRPGEGRIRTYGAFAGDLNGDGWSDLVLPNEDSNDLRILLNDGTGGYGAMSIVPVPRGGAPSTNEGADFDGDGDMDLAVGSAHGRFVTVFLGDGAGGLVHHQDLESGNDVRGLCALDLEGDGDADLAATSFGEGHVSVFVNDGAGNFTRSRTLNVGGGVWSCATGDADGDGLIDLFIGLRTSLQVAVLLSNGDGTFRESGRTAAGGDPWMLAAGDMNGDGNIDIVAINTVTEYVAVITGDGRGDLALAERYSFPGFPLAVDLGDLDGDGDLDVVTSSFEHAVFGIFQNDGSGRLTRRADALRASSAASCVVLHDRDGDGDLDITGIDELDDVIVLFENG